MADNGETKGIITPPHTQGEFLHNYYTLVSLQDCKLEGVVRIFVALSCELRLFNYIRLDYIMRHNFSPNKECNYAEQYFLYQECNITWNNFSPTRSVIIYITWNISGV